MNLNELINSALPVYELDAPLEKVRHFFEESTYSHVAIVEGERFLGLLPEYDLQGDKLQGSVEQLRSQMEVFVANSEMLWLEVLEIMAKHEANIVPVLDRGHKVVGYFLLDEIMSALVDTPFLYEDGGIIVVSKGIHDYSMSQVAQIVESNDAKVLGALITDTSNDLVQVTLKVTGGSFNEILQTFRRYGYQIDVDAKDDKYLIELKERSEYLAKFLNV